VLLLLVKVYILAIEIER